MKLKIIAIIFMMLLLSVITISEKINATDIEEIKVGMFVDHPKQEKDSDNKDKKGGTINPVHILDNWSWVVGDTEYLIRVDNITDKSSQNFFIFQF